MRAQFAHAPAKKNIKLIYLHNSPHAHDCTRAQNLTTSNINTQQHLIIHNCAPPPKMIIATLTTIRQRIEQGYTQQAILSILRQTTPPDCIYLFYSPDAALLDAGITAAEIANILMIPLQTAHPATVEKVRPIAVSPNTGPYRKLTPLFTPGRAFTPAPADIIITFDDDHQYAPDTIEKFLATYKTHNESVCVCSAAKRANLKGSKFPLSGITLPYVDPADVPALHLIPEGFGAVLYSAAMLSGLEPPTMPPPVTLATNDDIWFRLFTFARGVRVIVVNTDKHALIDAPEHQQPTLYNTYNSTGEDTATDKVIATALADPFMAAHTARWPTAEYIDMEDEVYTTKELTNIRHAFKAGTDVKLLQYERNAPMGAADRCVDFLASVRANIGQAEAPIAVMLINIEKDLRRYGSAVGELKKLGIPTFSHLKATYWRNREQFTQDINTIAAFLRITVGAAVPQQITFDAFSTPSDPAIHIQDGPLACYCSHLRAMIGAYMQGADAVLICEDDMMVADTAAMTRAASQIPGDWDVITFNSVPIGAADKYTVTAEQPWHRLTGPFYSTHFYLVRRKALPTIFRAMWPITDQVDILLSRLYPVLAMYNVPATVYQKNYSTNTQNNLWVILTSVGYEPVRARMRDFTAAYCTRVVAQVGCDQDIARAIVENAVIDVLHQYITANTTATLDDACATTAVPSPQPPSDIPADIYEPLHTIINCCVKGVGVHKACLAIIADIEAIITPFVSGRGVENAVPLGWGSTATVFLDTKDACVFKIFHTDGVRWKDTPATHKDIGVIFGREVAALERIEAVAPERWVAWRGAQPARGTLPVINMPYWGLSLYEDFRLPANWRSQLAAEFDLFTRCGIAYTEFNLKNICVGDGAQKLVLVDFGLADVAAAATAAADINAAACEAFVALIEQIADKFAKITDPFLRKVVYRTFMQNMRANGEYFKYVY